MNQKPITLKKSEVQHLRPIAAAARPLVTRLESLLRETHAVATELEGLVHQHLRETPAGMSWNDVYAADPSCAIDTGALRPFLASYADFRRRHRAIAAVAVGESSFRRQTCYVNGSHPVATVEPE